MSQRITHKVISFLFFFSLFATVSTAVFSKEVEEEVGQRYLDGEELFFTLRIDRFELGEIPSVVHNGRVALDFDSFIQFLEFAIYKDRDAESFSGWYIKEDYRFSLVINQETSTLTISVPNRKITIAEDQYTFLDNYLYIDRSVLADVFRLSQKVNIDSLVMDIQSSEPLPLQQRLLRRGSKLSRGSNKPQFATLDRSYGLLSPQILDINLTSSYRESTDSVSSRYSVLGSRDIALVHTNFFLSGTDEELLQDARLTFSRDSLKADLLGPLGVSRIELGDIRAVRQGRMDSEPETRGFRLTNTQFANQIDNELINIEGNVQPGWDVQLLRDGILLGQTFDNADGRYSFLDIPLNFGLNEFEIIQYGPQGEILVEKIERMVDRDLVGGNGFRYDVSLNQNNTSFLGVNDNDELNDDFNLSSLFSLSLANNTALTFGAQSLLSDEEDYSISLGINSVLFNKVLVNSQIATNDTSNNVSLSARTNLLNQSINSAISLNQQKDTRKNNVRLDLNSAGSLQLGQGFALPLDNTLRIESNDTLDRFEFTNRLGINTRLLSLFNSLTYTSIDYADGSNEDFFSGNLSMQRSFGPVYARASLNYREQDSGFEVEGYQANFNWNVSDTIRTRLNLTHNAITDNTSGSLYLGWLHDNLELNSTATYSDVSGWQGNIAARFTFTGYDSSYSNIYQGNRAMAFSGSLAVRVFHDLNDNAIYDEGEPVLPDVEVIATQAYRRDKTNEQGIANIIGVSNYKLTDITIDSETLPDPFMTPRVEGVSIQFRAGYVDHLDFPITIFSEIEGRIDLNDAGQTVPARGVSVVLLDLQNEVVKQVRTAVDGYYLFTKVIPGRYKVAVLESELARLDIRKTQSHQIRINQDTEFVSNLNIELAKQSYKRLHFSSLAKLNTKQSVVALASLLGQRQPSLKPYFMWNKIDGKYILSIAAAETEEAASQACKKRVMINIECEVISTSIQEKPSELAIAKN